MGKTVKRKIWLDEGDFDVEEPVDVFLREKDRREKRHRKRNDDDGILDKIMEHGFG